MASVTGQILIPDDETFSGATLYVRVSKTGLMDVAAPVVAEKQHSGVSAGDKIQFSLDVPEVESRDRYSVSAHVSMNGDDDVQKGDYVTKRDYAVLTHGAGSEVAIDVEAV